MAATEPAYPELQVQPVRTLAPLALAGQAAAVPPKAIVMCREDAIFSSFAPARYEPVRGVATTSAAEST